MCARCRERYFHDYVWDAAWRIGYTPDAVNDSYHARFVHSPSRLEVIGHIQREQLPTKMELARVGNHIELRVD